MVAQRDTSKDTATTNITTVRFATGFPTASTFCAISRKETAGWGLFLAGKFVINGAFDPDTLGVRLRATGAAVQQLTPMPCARSHKANYEVPRDIVQSANYGPVAPVVNPTMKAGDLLIFTEATLHCTLPWTNPHHETRRLLYRYSPKYIHMDGGTFEVTQPPWVSELTPAQQ